MKNFLEKKLTFKQKKVIPIIPLRGKVIFPQTESILNFSRHSSVAAVEAAFQAKREVCFVVQKNPNIEKPKIEDIYKVGTLCFVQRLLKTNGEVDALIKGIARVKIERLLDSEGFLLAEVNELPEISEKSDEIKALTKYLSSQVKKAINLGKPIEFLVFMRLMSGVSPAEMADQSANILNLKISKKQKLLEILEVKKRLIQVNKYLSHELKILEIEHSISAKTQMKFDKTMRKTILKERMKTIQRELGEKEENKEINDYKKKIKKAEMPLKVEKKALKELDRLGKMHTFNPEAGYIRTYLDWLVEMPWNKESPNNVSLSHAEAVLEKQHYGLKEVKERILEYLAVMKLKKKQKKATRNGSTILCFIGPPGVGKTSMGKSIAQALERKFVHLSFGGIRDEAEIRGHRRTYVGALPGRIIQGIKNAGTKNPVFMLDEIDKIGNDFRGDPSAALLEALDSEQNDNFSDHYLEVPFDLSQVMFITTANVLDTIPPALRDRLEIIRFSGYTYDEKFQIAKKFLIKKTLQNNGLSAHQIKIFPAVLRRIIQRYTREAGVRDLEREISKIMRKSARKIAEKRKKSEKVNLKNIAKFLGPAKFSATLAEKRDEIGVSTGLAWTQAGGEILFIEVALMPGKGKLVLTGHLGEVMKESCKAALSYVKSHWRDLGLKKRIADNLDIHIHVPEGAVPKDGPSAGVAIVTALASAFIKKKVKKEVGMTGEITLRGRVLEIGGVKEKIIAAHQAGLKEIILPKANKKDLDEIPKKIKKDFKFHFVSDLKEVLSLVFR